MKISPGGYRIYDSGYRGACRIERMEQIDCMSWLQFHHPHRWPLIFHCPNEVKAKPQHMSMRAKEGVKPGVPDIIDLGGPVSGVFELKRLDRTKSSITKGQREFLIDAAAAGHFTAICYGFEQFKLAYADYLNMCCGS